MSRIQPNRTPALETAPAPIEGVKKSIGTTIALKAAAHAKDRLNEITDEIRFIRQYVTGRKHYVLPGIAQVETETTTFNFLERIPAGQTFIGKRLTAQAPEESLLELYKNSVAPDNFIEVVTNIQVYANNIPGDMIIEGPAEIIAVVSKAKVAGNCSINLSGYLIPTLLHKYKGE